MARVSELGALTADHLTAAFDCGVESLNRWLHEHALQAQRSGSATTFVLSEGRRVLAYYALSNGSMTWVPESRLSKGLGKHDVPVILLSRLAVDVDYQGNDLGRFMLQDALHRIAKVATEVGVRAVQVHPINAKAAEFYGRFGFEALPDPASGLVLLMKDLQQHLRRN